MSAVCLIDTTVFLNLLNVPGKNQNKNKVGKDYLDYVELGMTFILPMATIIETGNHIAQNGDGRVRRETATRFCEVVKCSFQGETPYTPSEFPNMKAILSWLDKFPELAGRNKSPSRVGEGTSFGDLSIIEEYERCTVLYSMSEVFIWSFDEDLESYQYLSAEEKR